MHRCTCEFLLISVLCIFSRFPSFCITASTIISPFLNDLSFESACIDPLFLLNLLAMTPIRAHGVQKRCEAEQKFHVCNRRVCLAIWWHDDEIRNQPDSRNKKTNHASKWQSDDEITMLACSFYRTRNRDTLERQVRSEGLTARRRLGNWQAVRITGNKQARRWNANCRTARATGNQEDLKMTCKMSGIENYT